MGSSSAQLPTAMAAAEVDMPVSYVLKLWPVFLTRLCWSALIGGMTRTFTITFWR